MPATGAASGATTATAAARSPSPGTGGGVVIASAADGPPPNTPHTIALDPQLRQAAAAAVGYAGSNGSDGSAAVQDFLLALAVCNTVVPTATDQGHLLYQVGMLFERCWNIHCGAVGNWNDTQAVTLLLHQTLQRTFHVSMPAGQVGCAEMPRPCS
jgi:hypothetical protein